MITLKPRRLATIFTLLVLAVGSYIGWQIYLGQQLANQYTANAQKNVLPSSNNSVSPSSPTPSSMEAIPEASSAQTSPAPAPASASTPQTATAQTPASQTTPDPPSSPGDNPPSVDYKQRMSSTYQETLQAMQNVKGNTLALQGRKISLASYKASILQAQATFSSAEAFVQANPPSDTKLNPSYQEFLAGISIAKESMSVVLNGISSLSPSSLYAAREMGGNALQQVQHGYANF